MGIERVQITLDVRCFGYAYQWHAFFCSKKEGMGSLSIKKVPV